MLELAQVVFTWSLYLSAVYSTMKWWSTNILSKWSGRLTLPHHLTRMDIYSLILKQWSIKKCCDFIDSLCIGVGSPSSPPPQKKKKKKKKKTIFGRLNICLSRVISWNSSELVLQVSKIATTVMMMITIIVIIMINNAKNDSYLQADWQTQPSSSSLYLSSMLSWQVVSKNPFEYIEGNSFRFWRET